MPPVVKDRNNPTRGTASESTYSLMEFMRDWPDDQTCMDYLWRERFSPDGRHATCPKCKETRTFHLPQRPSVADTTNGPVGAGSESSSGMNMSFGVSKV